MSIGSSQRGVKTAGSGVRVRRCATCPSLSPLLFIARDVRGVPRTRHGPLREPPQFAQETQGTFAHRRAEHNTADSAGGELVYTAEDALSAGPAPSGGPVIERRLYLAIRAQRGHWIPAASPSATHEVWDTARHSLHWVTLTSKGKMIWSVLQYSQNEPLAEQSWQSFRMCWSQAPCECRAAASSEPSTGTTKAAEQCHLLVAAVEPLVVITW